MKKITFLVLHLGVGGIETATINICNTLCNDYDIEIVSFYKLENDLSSRLNKRIKVRYLYVGGPNRDEFHDALNKKQLLKLVGEIFKALSILIKKKLLIIKEIRKIKNGVIVSTRMEFNVLLSKYGNKNVIKIAQEHQYHNNDERYINTIKHKYKNLDYLLALTKTLEDDYKKFLDGTKVKVVLMPNMIFNLSKDRAELSNKNIISVGRFHRVKRFHLLINVLSKLPKDVKLTLVGDGDQKNLIENRIRDLSLEKRVTLTGLQNEEGVRKSLLDSSLFVMTSVSEGLPMVLLEAMDKGLPCIAFETPSGVTDIIKDGYNGFVIKDDDIKMMVKKIKYLLNKTDKLKEMGTNAKETAKLFSRKKIKDKWIELLNEINV